MTWGDMHDAAMTAARVLNGASRNDTDEAAAAFLVAYLAAARDAARGLAAKGGGG